MTQSLNQNNPEHESVKPVIWNTNVHSAKPSVLKTVLLALAITSAIIVAAFGALIVFVLWTGGIC